jgi:hypothetical protein
VNFGLYDGLHATPRLREFDPGARLENVHYQGGEFSVDAGGAKRRV